MNFFLDQHGCAKNQVDGELIISALTSQDWLRTDEPEKAELIIINSCGFIESAKTESLDSLMQARQSYPNAKIILAGCLAERYAELFAEEIPEIDGVFGNGDISKIADFAKKVLNSSENNKTKPMLKPLQKGVCDGNRSEILGFPKSAYVKITEGCDNCCSFCAIPIIRGNLRSRSPERIINEISELVKKGFYEINLIGQDLAAYGCEECFSGFENFSTAHYTAVAGSVVEEPCKSPLAILLEKIKEISGNFVVRLLYIHPDHFPLDILDVIKTDKRLLPYFDIPFQCGDDNLIKTMNRRGSASSYQKLVEKIRAAGKETEYGMAVLRTTFLCGFPGETDAAAQNTANFLRNIEPDWSGCFTYSREEDTPAYDFKKQVSKRVAQKRADALVEQQGEITSKHLLAHVGKTYDVLIEELLPPETNESENKSTEGIAIGRSWFQAPEVDGATVVTFDLDNEDAVANVKPGNVVKVKITGASEVDINGYYL